MKKYFITGLVTFLPVALTAFTFFFLINFLTAPFVEWMKDVLTQFNFLSFNFIIFSGEQLLTGISRVLILFILFFSTALMGFLARWFFIHSLINLGEFILHKIPLINTIYKTTKDVTHTIFQDKKTTFKQVVLIPFPNEGVKSIALVSGSGIKGPRGEVFTSVFVPTTPNLTTGFLIFLDDKDVTYLDMSIEEAFKYVISCGILSTQFSLKKEDLEDLKVEQDVKEIKDIKDGKDIK